MRPEGSAPVCPPGCSLGEAGDLSAQGGTNTCLFQTWGKPGAPGRAAPGTQDTCLQHRGGVSGRGGLTGGPDAPSTKHRLRTKLRRLSPKWRLRSPPPSRHQAGPGLPAEAPGRPRRPQCRRKWPGAHGPCAVRRGHCLRLPLSHGAPRTPWGDGHGHEEAASPGRGQGGAHRPEVCGPDCLVPTPAVQVRGPESGRLNRWPCHFPQRQPGAARPHLRLVPKRFVNPSGHPTARER